MNGERTLNEVFGNCKSTLVNGEFEILKEGYYPENNVATKIGGKTWIALFFKYNTIPNKSEIKDGKYSSTSGGSGYLAAILIQGDKAVYVVMNCHQYSNNEVAILLDIVGTGEMEKVLVKVDTDYLLKALQKDGHIPVYDIHFDHNESTITNESKKAINELVTLLEINPELQLYIVGHTEYGWKQRI